MNKKINIGLIGLGRMGVFHGETIAHRIKDANLYAIADPDKEKVESLVNNLEIEVQRYTDPIDLINDANIEAVVIASPARTHANIVIKAVQKGKAVFCEKPMAVLLEDANEIIDIAEKKNTIVQVGFNRRFEKGFNAARQEILAGNIGTPHILKSNTKDPKLSGAESIPEWTIFLETLIHDFDTLRYLNPQADPSEVFVSADALIRPDLKKHGLLDTAIVNIKFDNGSMAVAEASFQAVYGYDVKAEAFGSEGMITAGDIRETSMTKYDSHGVSYNTSRYDQDLLFDAYVSELRDFAKCVIQGVAPRADAKDARWALRIALGCIDSVKTNAPVKL